MRRSESCSALLLLLPALAHCPYAWLCGRRLLLLLLPLLRLKTGARRSMRSSRTIGKRSSSTRRSLLRILGDKRYNDQISDYSVKAYNEELAREQDFLHAPGRHRPRRVDRTRRRSAANCCCASLPRTRRPRSSRSGRCPSTRWTASTPPIRELVAQLSFTTVKDYDDWIARLHAIPKAFEQVTDQHVHRHGRPSRAAEVPAR